MGRDPRDEESRPNGKERVKKHKKDKHRSRDRIREQSRSPEDSRRDRSNRKQEKVMTEARPHWPMLLLDTIFSSIHAIGYA